MIRPVKPSDAKEICDIYNYYITDTCVTFEEEELSVKQMEKRINDICLKYLWLVYLHQGNIIGYAYAGEWKSRYSYRFAVETTVYLHPDFGGVGIGALLYKKLLDDLKTTDYHAAIGCITIPNKASVALHEKFGFRKIGEFREVGFKFDKWLDIGYWELLL
ncbi:GNAT family N-acetyltransferase [Marinifilum sp. RC60d5]|uniref:GNAT family N-acetyltransferase n=1 Tax=Marinifilum sp. RC60d5 TaxID=3458414 RepID=UPI0040373604